jgi:hypothetical protein
MTPKEKAIELWGKYFQLNYDWDGGTKDQWAKEGALIAVDEILNLSKIASLRRDEVYMELEYWIEVKKEIELL